MRARGQRIGGRGFGVAPTGLGLSSELFPALTGWASFCRAYSAEETRNQKSWPFVPHGKRAQRPGKKKQLHAWNFGAALLHQQLERSATHEKRVELSEERDKINVGIHDDPVELTVGASDVTVEAHGNVVANRAHGDLQRKFAEQ
jgi:hypothetical protein